MVGVKPSLALACIALASTAVARADDAQPVRESANWAVEVKRQNTDRATESESTKTTLRFDRLLDGAVALLRLDLPFPDDKTTFSGDLFNPRLGDIKVRAGFAPVAIAGNPWSSFVEATFPTANPESLGGGKYQLTAGARTSLPLGGTQKRAWSMGFLAQQVASVAGDPDRKDVNYTKLELSVRAVHSDGRALKVTLKPVIDWAQHAKNGAVTEMEGEAKFARHWRFVLMLGARAWGPSVASTYGKRVELTLGRQF